MKWKPQHLNTIDFDLKFLGQYMHDTQDMIFGLFVKNKD